MKTNVIYLEHDTEDGEDVVYTQEETICPQYLPRLGEHIYIGGKNRVVCKVTHYADTHMHVMAFHADDYHAVSPDTQELMDRHIPLLGVE